MNAGNVEVRHYVAVDSDVLSDLEALGVGQFFTIEFPSDFGGRITAGSALEKDTWSRLQSFFVEGRSNLRRLNCKKKLSQFRNKNFFIIGT